MVFRMGIGYFIMKATYYGRRDIMRMDWSQVFGSFTMKMDHLKELGNTMMVFRMGIGYFIRFGRNDGIELIEF